MVTPLSVRLRDALAKSGISHKALADQLEVGRSTVTHWVSGRAEPSIEAVEQIARVLGVDPGELAFGPASAARLRRAPPRPRLATAKVKPEETRLAG